MPSHLQFFLRADDGIRTRDPHLGKVLIGLRALSCRALTCGFVHPVVRREALTPSCCRAVYQGESEIRQTSAVGSWSE
jgi:hypothetical protein